MEKSYMPIDPVNYVTSAAIKVPEVTLVFWIIKIAATTLGEIGGRPSALPSKAAGVVVRSMPELLLGR